MLTFTERLGREIKKAAHMTLPELEAALAEGETRNVAQLTALSLAKKAAEGGMDAVKMIRELTKGEPSGEKQAPPAVEIRVVE